MDVRRDKRHRSGRFIGSTNNDQFPTDGSNIRPLVRSVLVSRVEDNVVHHVDGRVSACNVNYMQ